MSRQLPMETFDRRGRHRWTNEPGDESRSRHFARMLVMRFGDRVVLTLIALALIGGAFSWWWFTRPAGLSVTTPYADAIITFQDIDYLGDLTLPDLEPGSYPVIVERQGFEPFETTVELTRLRTAEVEAVLQAQDHTVTLASEPAEAIYRIEASDGTVLVGEAPFSGDLPAGQTHLMLSSDGYNDLVQEVFLDESLDLQLWMDPEGQLVHCLNVFESGPAPKGVTFTPDGSEVWVSLLAGPPSVQIFDPETGELLDEIALGDHGAVEILIDEDGERAYVSQMETALVYEIDVATREVLRELDTHSSWSKMMEFGRYEETIFVSNWTGDDISEIDLDTGELVKRRDTVDTPRGMFLSRDGQHLYVAGFGVGIIEKIRLRDGERETIYSGGRAVRHFAGDRVEGVLFASDMADDEIIAVDLSTDEVRHFADTQEKPNTIALSPDGKVLFVSCRGANNAVSYYIPGPEWGSVLLLDAQTGEPLDAIVGGNQPTALAVSADGTRMIFSDFLDNRLRYFEIPPYEELAAGDGGLSSRLESLIAK